MAILAEALQSIALKVAEARSVQIVLASIVHGLTTQPEVALARLCEHDNILAALEAAHGKIYGAGGAAEILGIKPTTLASRDHAAALRLSRRRRHG